MSTTETEKSFSSLVQARITKFGPEVQHNLVKIPIVIWDNWPWPSRSNYTPKSKFTPFWACPCHNSPPIEVTNLEQKCILALFRSLPILGLIEIYLQFNFQFQTQTQWAIYVHHWHSLVRPAILKVGRIERIWEGVNQFKEQPLEQLLGIDCFTMWKFHGGIILSVPLEEDLLSWRFWWDWGSGIFTILCCILI